MQKGIKDAITHAYNLRAIRLNVQIFPISSFRTPVVNSLEDYMSKSSSYSSIHNESRSDNQEEDSNLGDNGRYSKRKSLTVLDARDMMLRPRSRLRKVTVGSLNFKV